MTAWSDFSPSRSGADDATPPSSAAGAPAAIPVPEGRTRRLLHLGRAVGELAVGAAAEGMRQWARGQRPPLAALMLTPANARRLAERLAAMRGAAMKVGQLLSMDGQALLPPQAAELLGRLRDRAAVMPERQLAQVLVAEYGRGWRKRFRRFETVPVASASIGQVHRAETPDGRVLALKIQHPGIRQSIASDLANLALLARTPGLVPAGLDVQPLLRQVRDQLQHETDYAAEARALTDYRARLGDDPVFTVPALADDFCTPHILATAFMPGVPIDRLATEGAPQALRDRVADALCRLLVREVFTMRLVQTDPNFANYLFDAASGRIALLDFGAAQTVSLRRVAALRRLARALHRDDGEALRVAALAMGFIGADDPPAQTAGVLAMVRLAGLPLRIGGRYDFAHSPLIGQIMAQGQTQYFGVGFSRTPPPELLFLQRKFAGTFMQCVRLRAHFDVAAAFAPALGRAVPPVA